jgi:hypothetical protein
MLTKDSIFFGSITLPFLDTINLRIVPKKIMNAHLTHPKLLIRFKCKFEGENNGRRSWDAFPNSQHFGGKKGMLEL